MHRAQKGAKRVSLGRRSLFKAGTSLPPPAASPSKIEREHDDGTPAYLVSSEPDAEALIDDSDQLFEKVRCKTPHTMADFESTSCMKNGAFSLFDFLLMRERERERERERTFIEP